MFMKDTGEMANSTAKEKLFKMVLKHPADGIWVRRKKA